MKVSRGTKKEKTKMGKGKSKVIDRTAELAHKAAVKRAWRAKQKRREESLMASDLQQLKTRNRRKQEPVITSAIEQRVREVEKRRQKKAAKAAAPATPPQFFGRPKGTAAKRSPEAREAALQKSRTQWAELMATPWFSKYCEGANRCWRAMRKGKKIGDQEMVIAAQEMLVEVTRQRDVEKAAWIAAGNAMPEGKAPKGGKRKEAKKKAATGKRQPLTAEAFRQAAEGAPGEGEK